MLYRYLGLIGSNPPVSFVTGDLLLLPTLVALSVMVTYCLARRLSGRQTFLLLCLTVYISAVIEVTLFPMPISLEEVARVRNDPLLFIPPDLNPAPFRSILDSVSGARVYGWSVFARNWLGNLLLLMPLGFMAPLIWSRFRSAFQALALCAATSLSIEFVQYVGTFLVLGVKWKSVDVDDVMVNVVGGMLGFAMCVSLMRLRDEARRFWVRSEVSIHPSQRQRWW